MPINAPSLQRIAALEKQASAWPQWFRFKVGFFAVTAEILFQITLVAPWVLLLGSSIFWFRHPLFITLVAVVVLTIWWALQPSMPIDGYTVTQDNAPGLYEVLNEVVRDTNALKIHEIRIDNRFNAGALELGHGWIPGKVRRILILGGPLVASLSAPSLKAVIAHEIGHFSRHHGRLGHWVYRARLGWQQSASYDHPDNSLIDQGVARIGKLFLQWFNDYAFVHSRLCEYEADAMAAKIVGAPTLALALAELHIAAQRFHDDKMCGYAQLNLEHSEMPENIWTIAAHNIKQAPLTHTTFMACWQEPPASDDTHPALSQRALALGCHGDDVWQALSRGAFANTGSCSDTGLTLAAQDDIKDQALTWRLDHARLTMQKQLAWQASNTSADHQTFTDALEKIRLHDAAAVMALQTLITTNPSWAAAARGALASAPQQWLTPEEREKNLQLWDAAIQRRSQAKAQWFQAFFDNTASLDALEYNTLQVLSACIAAHPYIEAAAAGQSVAPSADKKRNYPIVMVWIRVNPEPLQKAATTDDAIAIQIAYQIQHIAGPNVLIVVKPSYTTESKPSWANRLMPLMV
jgi:Zn-dependent protease with chaperone function